MQHSFSTMFIRFHVIANYGMSSSLWCFYKKYATLFYTIVGVAFSHSDLESGFHLYHQVPQTLVPYSSNSILEEVGICSSTMLAVE